MPSNALNTSGNITSSTGTLVLSGLTGTNRIMAGVYAPQGSTYTSAAVVVEGLNGSTWSAIPMIRMDNGLVETGVVSLHDNESRGWESQQTGTWSSVRIRATALGSGTLGAGLATAVDASTPHVPVAVPEVLYSTGGRYNATIAAGVGTADAVVSSVPSRLCRVVVLATATAATSIYDNTTAVSASATEIFRVPANPTAGTVYDLQIPTFTGIVVGKVSNSAPLCVTYLPLQ